MQADEEKLSTLSRVDRDSLNGVSSKIKGRKIQRKIFGIKF
ncbi:hypothetical protein [Domibacillus indicus]|nr:hypothetical protein [Domibacillus indicus]